MNLISIRVIAAAVATSFVGVALYAQTGLESSQSTEKKVTNKYIAPTSRDRIGRVWIPVRINGKEPFRFALDTASDSSAIVASAVEKLGLEIPKNTSIRIHGVTGTAVVPSIMVSDMTVGALALKDVRLPVVEGVFGNADGVLGTRLWKDIRIVLDFQKGQVHISRSESEIVPPGYTVLPIIPTKEHLLAIEIGVGKLRTKAILDTGAQQSIGNYRMRASLFPPDVIPKEQLVKGVTLDTVRGENIAIPKLTFGDIALRDLHVIFGEMSIFERWNLNDETVLMLGMDAIGALGVVIIDYKMNEVQLLPRR